MNLLIWLGAKVTRRPSATPAIIWGANVFTAFVFALVHITPVAQLFDLNTLSQAMIIAGALAAGTIFGYIYSRHGLTAAVVTHSVAGAIVFSGVRITMFVSA